MSESLNSMTPSHMTPRQLEILKTIKAFVADHGRGPTRQEIVAAINTSSSFIRDQINHLERHGLIGKGHRVGRAWTWRSDWWEDYQRIAHLNSSAIASRLGGAE